jgi:hypothetical protein
MTKLTAQRLRELFHYDPDTGIFTWRVKPRKGCVQIADIAGHVNHTGYRSIKIDQRAYRAHRLAWLYMYGVWPPGDLDHDNTIKDDNRLVNLREATDPQNQANIGRGPLKSVVWLGATPSVLRYCIPSASRAVRKRFYR